MQIPANMLNAELPSPVVLVERPPNVMGECLGQLSSNRAVGFEAERSRIRNGVPL